MALIRSRDPDFPVLPERIAPYPAHVPLDHGEVTAALWHAKGNLHEAARLIQTSPARLGNLVRRTPQLQEERARAAELLLDKAEQKLDEALDSPDAVRADSTARFILEKAGKTRGWTKDGTGGIALAFGTESRNGALAVRWLTDSDG